jgi:hypothetical protein
MSDSTDPLRTKSFPRIKESTLGKSFFFSFLFLKSNNNPHSQKPWEQINTNSSSMKQRSTGRNIKKFTNQRCLNANYPEVLVIVLANISDQKTRGCV